MNALSFNPDGRFLVVGSRGNAALVWDVTTSQEVAQLEHAYSNIMTLLFSPDGQWLATGTSEIGLSGETEASGDVRIWATTNWQQVSQMESGPVFNLAFSPDSQWLVTGRARIWEVKTGQEVARIPHTSAFNTVFSPDGHTTATAGSDGTTRIWLWQPQDLIEEACARLTRNMTKIEWRQYLGDEPYQATCPNLPMPQN
jgi:WD40 repeat protein